MNRPSPGGSSSRPMVARPVRYGRRNNVKLIYVYEGGGDVRARAHTLAASGRWEQSVHCTLQGFIARLVVRADKGRRAVWAYRVHGGYNATHENHSVVAFSHSSPSQCR